MLQSLISVVNISHCGCWIENDSIYILTHADLTPAIEARFDAIRAAAPK